MFKSYWRTDSPLIHNFLFPVSQSLEVMLPHPLGLPAFSPREAFWGQTFAYLIRAPSCCFLLLVTVCHETPPSVGIVHMNRAVGIRSQRTLSHQTVGSWGVAIK